MIDWLGHHDEGLVEGQLVPGDQLTFDLSAGDQASLRRPDGSIRPLTIRDSGKAVWGPVELAGVHSLTDAEGRILAGGQRVVRFPASSESALAAMPSLTLGQETIVARADGVQRYRPIWPWAIGVSLVVLMLEWWIWSRRVGGSRPRRAQPAIV